MIDILLPMDAESERLVLGALMTDVDAVQAAVQTIETEDFGIEKHRRIFAAISDLWRGGDLPDRISVARYLQSAGKLEAVDGVGYLCDLEVGMPQLFNLEGYMRRLRDLNTRRRIIHRLDSLHQMATDQSVDIETLTNALQNANREATEAQIESDGLLTFSEYIAQYPGGLEAFLSPDTDPPIPTPWSQLNEILDGGWRPGELTVIAARPGYGKSAAAGQIAFAAAASGAYVDVFSLEMQNRQIWHRMISGVGRVSLKKFQHNHCPQEDRHAIHGAMGKLADMRLLRISDKPHRTLQAIENILRKKKAKRPLNLVIIDYLQLMQMAKRPRSRVEEVTELTRSLKILAMEMGMSLIVLAQINRESVRDEREPDLHDLRESGSVEQDADCVMFLYQKPSDKAMAIARRAACPTQILVKKHRSGPLGKVDCLLDGRFVVLEEATALEGSYE